MASSQGKKLSPPPTFYELFGASPHVDANQLRKSWEELEKIVGTNKKKHSLGEKAYECLHDPAKREWYGVMTDLDKFNLPETSGSSFNISEDTYNDTNIKKFVKIHDKHKRREDNLTNINITLEDVYTGKTVSVLVNRIIPCHICPNGLGKIDASCPACTHIPTWRMLQLCAVCGNTKRILKNCESCDGKGTTIEKQQVTVEVKKGAYHGMKILLKGIGNRRKINKTPEDIVFRVHIASHKTFMRQGNNLFVTKVLQLSEVLCRKPFVLEHLNGRKLKVGHGSVNITPGSTMLIANEGLPVLDSDAKGDLIVSFGIEFPTELPLNVITTLKQMFPPPAEPYVPPKDAEVYVLKTLEIQGFSNRKIPPIFDENYPGHRMFPHKDPSKCNMQ